MSRDGRDASFEALYRAHVARVWAVCHRLGVPDGELEDAVQEVFVVVHRKLGGFRGEARLGTWIYAIARRVAAWRRRKLRVRAFLRLTAEPAVEAAGSAGLEAARLLARLAPERRATVVLHELDGYGPTEIAEMMGCPVETVRSRLRLARRDLARMTEGA